MLADLEALAAPAIVAAAFGFGVVVFLRRQLGAGQGPRDDEDSPDISDASSKADSGERPPAASAGDQKV